jgi:type I restriction enzyme R subunit
MRDFRTGDSGYHYPENIKRNIHAQAFYGVVGEVFRDAQGSYGSEEQMGLLAADIAATVEKHSKVDWHDNIDVHNRIAQEIDDLLYRFAKQQDIKLDYEQIDKIIENVKTVALRRY